MNCRRRRLSAKYVLLVGSIAGVLSLIACGAPSVTCPDANLELAIRESINKSEGPIFAAELKQLTVFVANGRNIGDLRGLEYCSNLETLSLAENSISDVSQLASLPLVFP